MDTDVVVAALRSPAGGSATVLRAVRREQATLLLSNALLVEYEAVCGLADHRQAAGLDLEELGLFLDGLAFLAEHVEIFFRWRPQLRDPGDEMVLDAAVNGRAQALVTFNRCDYGDALGRFGIEVLNPGEVLRRIRA